MFVLKLIFLFFALSTSIYAQVNLEWAACYNGPGNSSDVTRAICVDDSGNVYVTGASSETSIFRPNYATIKYDRNGNVMWIRRYGENNVFQLGHDLTVDAQSNVYVTGGSQTLKYNSLGDLLWVFDNDAECFKIILNKSGDLYVAGTSYNNYKLIKLDSNGGLIWYQLYNGPADYRDNFTDMVMDSQGNIIVTGRSQGIGTHWDYATIKYSPEGDSLWVRRYNGPCSSFPGDYAHAVTVDDEDNVYVTGWSDGVNCNAQCFTIAYSSNGDVLWEHRYPGVGYAGYDVLYSKGYVYVVARSGGNEDVLLKYDKQGNVLWSRSYPSDHLFVTIPPGLATDSEGNIYLRTINWDNNILRSNYVVLKYKPEGTILWEYNYPAYGINTANAGRDFVLDKDNNIYITGSSQGWVCPGGGLDYLTIKISQDKVSIDPQSEIVTEYELHQNYPNPFNPETKIKFSIPSFEGNEALANLVVYDITGREIIQLLNNQNVSNGIYEVTFDGRKLSSGVYFYKLEVNGKHKFKDVKRMVLLK